MALATLATIVIFCPSLLLKCSVLRQVLRTACAWWFLASPPLTLQFLLRTALMSEAQCHTIEYSFISILVSSPCGHLCILRGTRCCCFSLFGLGSRAWPGAGSRVLFSVWPRFVFPLKKGFQWKTQVSTLLYTQNHLFGGLSHRGGPHDCAHSYWYALLTLVNSS